MSVANKLQRIAEITGEICRITNNVVRIDRSLTPDEIIRVSQAVSPRDIGESDGCTVIRL